MQDERVGTVQRDGISLVRSLCFAFAGVSGTSEVQGPGRDDGGTRNCIAADDDSALSTMLCLNSRSAGREYFGPVGRSWRCDETYIKVKGVGPTYIERWIVWVER